MCSICGKELPLDNFYKKTVSKDGYRSECKTCGKLRITELCETRIYINIIEKCCSQCNIIKPVTYFYKNKRSKDGYSCICKQCYDKSKINRVNNFIEPSKNIIEKLCSKCNITKHISEFGLDKYSIDGYHCICKKCVNTNSRKHVIIYDNVVHDIRDTKRCYKCKKIKNIHEFHLNKYCKDGHRSECKSCSVNRSRIHRSNNPELYKKYDHKHRNFGYKSINKTFNWCDAHHLHLENNHNFIINIPCFLHRLYSHNSYTWNNMDSINAIALDFWINENFYKNLYEI